MLASGGVGELRVIRHRAAHAGDVHPRCESACVCTSQAAAERSARDLEVPATPGRQPREPARCEQHGAR